MNRLNYEKLFSVDSFLGLDRLCDSVSKLVQNIDSVSILVLNIMIRVIRGFEDFFYGILLEFARVTDLFKWKFLVILSRFLLKLSFETLGAISYDRPKNAMFSITEIGKIGVEDRDWR